MRNVMLKTITVAALAAALTVTAWSQNDAVGPEEAEKLGHERSEFMKGLGQSMRTLKGFLSGRNSPEEAIAAARGMQDASAVIPSLFPPGTGMDVLPKTQALDAVWENWDDFTMAAQLLGERARALEAALGSDDGAAVEAAFGALGAQGCGGCHRVFRQKDH